MADHVVADKTELALAVRNVNPGDVIIMRDRVWRSVQLRLLANGQPGKPITLKAQTPGKVVLSGCTSIVLAGSFIVIDGLTFEDGPDAATGIIGFARPGETPDTFRLSSSCRITQCAFIDPDPDDDRAQYSWITLYGRHHEVDHCTFKGFGHGGHEVAIHLHKPSPENGHRVHHNYFAGRPPLGRNGAETIYVGGSGVAHLNSRSMIEHNLFENCDGEGEIITNKSSENVYRNNTFRECEGALTLRHGDRCTVEGNYFLGSGRPNTGGVRVIGEGHTVRHNYFADLAGTGPRSALSMVNGMSELTRGGYHQVQNARVAYNTFVNCRSIVVGLWKDKRPKMTLPPKDCTFASNVLLGSASPAISIHDQPINMTWRSNIVWDTDPGVQEKDGFQRLDPRLVEGRDGVFRLSKESPRHGAADAELIEDGDSKPADIGCRQCDRDGRLRTPLTPHDVGPSWMRH